MRIILHEDTLITSDEQGLKLYAITAGAPALSAAFAQPTLRDQFALHRDGEVLTPVRAGVFVRAFVSSEAPAQTQIARFDLSLNLLGIAPAAIRLNHERLDLSHDGARVAATAFGEGVAVLDAVTGARLFKHPGHMGSGAAWSPDDGLIAAGDSGQAGGTLYLLALGAADEVTRHALPKPKSKMPLYDSPFDVAFAPDGGLVAFSCVAWGRRGVAVYEVAARVERWSVDFPMLSEDEEQETWEVLEVAFAASGAVVVCGIEGCLQAWRAADGVALTALPCDGATSTRFAADDRRQRVWFDRDGELAWEPYPTDWR